MTGRRLATRKPPKGTLPPRISARESNKVLIMLWLAFRNRIHSRKILYFWLHAERSVVRIGNDLSAWRSGAP